MLVFLFGHRSLFTSIRLAYGIALIWNEPVHIKNKGYKLCISLSQQRNAKILY
jgi:hypothetical protein